MRNLHVTEQTMAESDRSTLNPKEQAIVKFVQDEMAVRRVHLEREARRSTPPQRRLHEPNYPLAMSLIRPVSDPEFGVVEKTRKK